MNLTLGGRRRPSSCLFLSHRRGLNSILLLHWSPFDGNLATRSCGYDYHRKGEQARNIPHFNLPLFPGPTYQVWLAIRHGTIRRSASMLSTGNMLDRNPIAENCVAKSRCLATLRGSEAVVIDFETLRSVKDGAQN